MYNCSRRLDPKSSWRELGRVLSNSTELSVAKRKRFFGHARVRYFLMYLSAISAWGTSNEFDGKRRNRG